MPPTHYLAFSWWAHDGRFLLTSQQAIHLWLSQDLCCPHSSNVWQCLFFFLMMLTPNCLIRHQDTVEEPTYFSQIASIAYYWKGRRKRKKPYKVFDTSKHHRTGTSPGFSFGFGDLAKLPLAGILQQAFSGWTMQCVLSLHTQLCHLWEVVSRLRNS